MFLQCSGVGLPYFVRGDPTFVLWVKPFVVPMLNGQILSVFEQRCMHLALFSKISAVFCVARDIN